MAISRFLFLIADDLPQVLRQAPPPSYQLPQEEVWSHLQHPTQEEAEVNVGLSQRLAIAG